MTIDAATAKSAIRKSATAAIFVQFNQSSIPKTDFATALDTATISPATVAMVAPRVFRFVSRSCSDFATSPTKTTVRSMSSPSRLRSHTQARRARPLLQPPPQPT